MNVDFNKKSNQRKGNDPINFINIQCDIPKSLTYDIGSTSVFNFQEEI
jgi:hypothetical protein